MDDDRFTEHPRFGSEPLDSTRTWSAAFHSYDQRNEWVYYIVAIEEQGAVTDRLLAQLDAWRGGMAWTLPVYAEVVRRDLEAVARSGVSNVAYTGDLTGSWMLVP